MTISRFIRHRGTARWALIGMLAFAAAGPVSAWQSASPPIKPVRPIVIGPSPSQQFHQTVQQQQARDRLQKSQQQQQLRQGVSSNAERPNVVASKAQQQRDQAEQAQRIRDQAKQQDPGNQYRPDPTLPRVVPKALPPPAQDDGDD